MRIGIDARFYGTLGKGLGRYASELIRQLEQTDHENEYLIFLRKENFDDYTPHAKNFRKIQAEFPWYSLREQIIYPFWLMRFKLDLMHFTHFNVPMLYHKPFVVTIHDLILLKHPTPRASTLGPLLFKIKFAFYTRVITHALRAAEEILTVSGYTKNDVKETFPFTENKNISVTHLACAAPFLDTSDTSVPKTVEGIRGPFMLYVGNAYPHKNLERLLAAFTKFKQKTPDYRLILVGSEDHFYRRLKREAQAAGVEKDVIFFGRASDEELKALYKKADFYVFPSLHEGFGLPPLEAMCHDLPVAAAQATSLPEILGDAAFFFDPKSEDDIEKALTRMATDEPIRTELIEKGRARASVFDWPTCARRTLGVYRRALHTTSHE